jgi:hypothetical protein
VAWFINEQRFTRILRNLRSSEQMNIKYIYMCMLLVFYVGQKDRLLPNFNRTFTISKADRTDKFRKHYFKDFPSFSIVAMTVPKIMKASRMSSVILVLLQ